MEGARKDGGWEGGSNGRARPQEAVRPVRPWPYHYFSK